MRKILTLCSLMLGSLVALNAAERNVSSEPALRGILLEEFTGIHCGYCPQGHAIAHAMEGMHPDQVSIISVHAGSFADPYPTEPDFRTAEGKAINDYFGVSGYPSGIVDRHDYGGGVVCGRSTWTDAARSVQYDIADVNLWAKAVYDGSERNLTIDLEGWYLNNLPDGPIYVNIAITQNRIPGPQNGAMQGNEYNHEHVLRMMVTPVEGERVILDSEDGFFSRHYTVDIPSTIVNTDVDPLKIDAVIYITLGREEVVNSMTVHPTYKNFVRKGSLELADDFIAHDGQSFAGDVLSLRLTNFTAKDLKSIDYEMNVAQSSGEGHIDFDEPIRPGECRVVDFTLCETLGQKDAKITIKPTKANGSSVECNQLKLEVMEALHVATEGNMVFRPDRDFEENVYSLRSFDGKTELVPTIEAATGQTETWPYTLEDGVYALLQVTDLWGDGVLNPRGIVKLTDTEGNMQAQSLEIPGFGVRIYVVGDKSKNSPSGFETIISEEELGQPSYYSIDGRYLGSEISSLKGQLVIERRGSHASKVFVR